MTRPERRNPRKGPRKVKGTIKVHIFEANENILSLFPVYLFLLVHGVGLLASILQVSALPVYN